MSECLEGGKKILRVLSAFEKCLYIYIYSAEARDHIVRNKIL